MYLPICLWSANTETVIKAYYILRAHFPINLGSMMQNSAGFLLWVVVRTLVVKNNEFLLAEGVEAVPLWRNGMTVTQNSVSFSDLL